MGEWPRTLRPLVERHGKRHVLDVFMREIGFPPAWGVSGSQLKTLVSELRKEPPLW